MKRIWINDIEYLIPQSWAECSFEQVTNGLTISLYLQTATDKKMIANYWVGLLKVMLPELPEETFYALSGEQVYRIKPFVEWASRERISKKPFDFFEYKGVRYYLPSENFSDTSCIEMALSSIYYLAFTRAENPDKDAVLKIVATLCRPQRPDLKYFRKSKDWNGDVREEFNSIVAGERSFSGLPEGVVMAVLQYYEFMQEQFSQRYKDNYGEDESDVPTLFPNGDGIIALLEEVAETGTHGAFSEVCSTNAHTIFMYIRHKLVINRARAKAQDDAEND